MLYLCLTFDYELFFGDNFGSYDEILFHPTSKLIDTLSEKSISATFFVDVCSIPQALRYNQIAYVEKFTKQIQDMTLHEQDVQLHIHPHWFHSKWEDGAWKFSNEGYRIHEFGFGNDGAGNIIKDGIKYLKDSLKNIDPKYECIAYRAGGFSIQPHKELVWELYKNGIRVDSSIAPDLFSGSGINQYDYRNKIKKINWYISPDSEWWEDSKDDIALLEIPVATINKPAFIFLARRLFRPNSIKLFHEELRGTYVNNQEQKKNRIKSIVNYLLGYNTISMDAYSADYLYEQVRKFYKKNIYKKDDKTDCIIALIGHPKLIDNAYIKNLAAFIDLIKEDNRFYLLSITEAYQIAKKSYGKYK